MTNNATKTYHVGVIERAISTYEVEAEDARAAAENWHEGEFFDHDDEALDSEGPCHVYEKQRDGSWRKIPKAEWQDAPPAAADPGLKPYSVLLLYPGHATDGATQTYYAFVESASPIEAVALAQQQANEWDHFDPEDFTPLLVIEGRHASQPLFNK
jgi:hypothetical protein